MQGKSHKLVSVKWCCNKVSRQLTPDFQKPSFGPDEISHVLVIVIYLFELSKITMREISPILLSIILYQTQLYFFSEETQNFNNCSITIQHPCLWDFGLDFCPLFSLTTHFSISIFSMVKLEWIWENPKDHCTIQNH